MMSYQQDGQGDGAKRYGAFSITEEAGTPLMVNSAPLHNIAARSSIFPQKNSSVANVIVFVATFLFYTYCIFEALSPVSIHDNGQKSHWHILGTANNGTDTNSRSEECTITNVAGGTVTGLVVGTALVVGGLWLIGLSTVGPVAGGLFAMNMGSGLTAGSFMAGLQSAAMTGTAYATGAGVGAAVGAGASAAGCA